MYEWGYKGRASVVVGGQFGSEGKGNAAAWLAENMEEKNKIGLIATTNAGAQAGHTTRYRDGRKFVCFHLPTTSVALQVPAFINAGSIIDIDTFFREIDDCGMQRNLINISPFAAVIRDKDRAAEVAPGSSTQITASTQKGVGAALTGKIMRSSPLAKDYAQLSPYVKNHFGRSISSMLAHGFPVVVEVPQGLGLSINLGFYPHTTSRDCWVANGLADAGIHPSFVGPICMVVRTFPIRVGNITDPEGRILGTSGPFYKDSKELSWELHFKGIEPERTTVTKRVRRIASWSHEQYLHGLQINRPTIVFMSFCDYLGSSKEFMDRIDEMEKIEKFLGLTVHKVYAFGPNVEDATPDLEAAVCWYDNRSF